MALLTSLYRDKGHPRELVESAHVSSDDAIAVDKAAVRW